MATALATVPGRTAINNVPNSDDSSDDLDSDSGKFRLQPVMTRKLGMEYDEYSSSSTTTVPSHQDACNLSTLLLVEVTTPWRMMKPKTYFGPNVYNVLRTIDLARQSWKNERDRNLLNLKVTKLISAQNLAGNTALEVRFILEYAKNYFLSRDYEKTLEQCEFVEKRADYITNENVRNHLLLVKNFLEIASFANLKKHGSSQSKIHELGELIRTVSTDYNDFFRLSYNIGTHYVGQIAIMPQPTPKIRNTTAMHFKLCMDYQQEMMAQGQTLTLGKIQLYNPAIMAIKVYLDFPEKEFGRKRHVVTDEDLMEANVLLKQVQSVIEVNELRSAWRLWARVQLTVAGYHFRSAQIQSKVLIEKHIILIHEFDQLCKHARKQAEKIASQMEENNAPIMENIGENINKLTKGQFFDQTGKCMCQWLIPDSSDRTIEAQTYIYSLSTTFHNEKDNLHTKVTAIEADISELIKNITDQLLPRLQPLVKNCERLDTIRKTLPTSADFIEQYSLAQTAIKKFQDMQTSLVQETKITLEKIKCVSLLEKDLADIRLFITNTQGNQHESDINEGIAQLHQRLVKNLQSTRLRLFANFQNWLSVFEKKYFKSFANLHRHLCTVARTHQSICVDIRCEIQNAVQTLSSIIADAEVGNVYEELKLAKEFHRYLATTVSPDCTDDYLLTTLWPQAVVTEMTEIV